MHDAFGMTFYYSDMLPVGYFIIYLPFVFFIVWIFYKLLLKHIPQNAVRYSSTAVMLLILSGVPWLSVYQLSSEAKIICDQQGGLHIYKTVEVDGFRDGWDIETASKYGFSYLERGGGDYMNRWTMVDGQSVRQKVTEFKSQYHVVTGADYKKIGKKFTRSASQVKHAETGEVLGELVTISIKPIYLDATFISMVGGSVGVWLCGRKLTFPNENHELSYDNVILATLKPRKHNTGVEK